MDRLFKWLPRYVALLARYVLSDDDIERETLLIDAGELARGTAAGGPNVDLMHELHRRAQSTLAERWHDSPPESPEQRGRERLVQGDAASMLAALTLPHEIALRAHHEQRWRREHETLVAMFEQTDDPILVLDSDGLCDDVNPAFCRLTGWTRREAVEGAGAWSEPPTAAEHRRRVEQRCRDGRHLLIEWSVSPILDRHDRLLSHVCIGRDVGRQQQIEASLRENDKLRAISTLAGGIAHDFNNLLGSILGLTELCQLEAAEGSRQARNLARIRQASDKAAALVRQMLDFSRQTPTQLQRVSIRSWMGDSDGMLRAALPHHQTLAIEVLEDAEVDIDPVQMEQVLLNIVRNGAQAMGERHGEVRITVDLAEPANKPPGPTGHLRIRIADAGDGIPPDLLGKIFEPFFTTKPVGEGTGLGLAAVHGIVSAHGGTVEVASEVGVGTTFSVFLPRVAAA